MSANIQSLTIEFMEEFYVHVKEKTPSFMPRPESEVALANSLTALLAAVSMSIASAQNSDEMLAGLAPLVYNMNALITAYTEEGEERETWIGQMEEFRSYVIGELQNGS